MRLCIAGQSNKRFSLILAKLDAQLPERLTTYMAETDASANTTLPTSSASTRRASFRRSLHECNLSPDALDLLEQKRRALDDSIHKYIASKEREYKQYEKDLRHKAKRLSNEISQSDAPAYSHTTSSESATLQHNDARHSDVAEQRSDNVKRKSKKRGEDFPGVFTPEYLHALDHNAPARPSSERPKPGMADTVLVNGSILRTNSDSAVVNGTPLSPRLSLAQRTSSSGSSADGKLISALKSIPANDDLPKAKRKRVSLAVGDAIVAPSDNVPVSLSVNSSSSHSRAKTLARAKSFPGGIDDASNEQPTIQTSTVVDAIRKNGSVSAAAMLFAEAQAPAKPIRDDDVGDMFDLEDPDIDQTNEDVTEDDEHPSEDQTHNEIAGRVSQLSLQPSQDQDDLQAEAIEPGEPPPESDGEEPMPLSYTEKASQPIREPGFRRPSVTSDPVYGGRNYDRVEEGAEDSGMYSSSFSRPAKGSFTSGSLGESFMARNAEKMTEMRAQQREQRSPRQPHALPVR